VLALSHGPSHWIPAGNWAEWVGSVLAGVSLVVLAVGLHRERQARRQDENERKTERRVRHARHAAVWLTVTGGGTTTASPTGMVADVRVTVVNTSDQPLYNCFVSSIVDVPGASAVNQWVIGTLPPHAQPDRSAHFDVLPSVDVNDIDNSRLVAEFMFTDSNGVGWVRTHYGQLVESFSEEWTSRMPLSTLERCRQLKQLWEDGRG
jgi:hypothetical protein